MLYIFAWIMECTCHLVVDRVSIVSFSIFFFFFKHKTAYDMRISDWSSDVCSSDLSVRRVAMLLDLDPATLSRSLGISAFARTTRLKKIGRASCRERVCQDV